MAKRHWQRHNRTFRSQISVDRCCVYMRNVLRDVLVSYLRAVSWTSLTMICSIWHLAFTILCLKHIMIYLHGPSSPINSDQIFPIKYSWLIQPRISRLPTLKSPWSGQKQELMVLTLMKFRCISHYRQGGQHLDSFTTLHWQKILDCFKSKRTSCEKEENWKSVACMMVRSSLHQWIQGTAWHNSGASRQEPRLLFGGEGPSCQLL